MTLKSAIRSMRENEAAKRPSMCGYVRKDVSGLAEEEVDAGKYRLVFVGKDGKETSFGMGGAECGETIAADAAFVENLIEDNWEIASLPDLEASRSGKGNW